MLRNVFFLLLLLSRVALQSCASWILLKDLCLIKEMNRGRNPNITLLDMLCALVWDCSRPEEGLTFLNSTKCPLGLWYPCFVAPASLFYNLFNVSDP